MMTSAAMTGMGSLHCVVCVWWASWVGGRNEGVGWQWAVVQHLLGVKCELALLGVLAVAPDNVRMQQLG